MFTFKLKILFLLNFNIRFKSPKNCNKLPPSHQKCVGAHSVDTLLSKQNFKKTCE